MLNESQSQKITITEIPKDGECGYAAIGKSRTEVISFLQGNADLDITEAIAQHVTESASPQGRLNQWLRQDVPRTEQGVEKLNSMVDQYCEACQGTDSLQPLFEELKRYIRGCTNLRQLYLEYNRQEGVYVHPQLLLRYAQANQIQLYIWQLDRSHRLAPLSNFYGDFSSSNTEDSTSRMHILFVNGNHFEGLEITGFGPDETLEGFEVTLPVAIKKLSPQNSIPPAENKQSSPSSVPLLSSSMPAHPTDPADTGLISWVESLGQARGRLGALRDDLNGTILTRYRPDPNKNNTHPLTKDLIFAYVNQLVVVLQKKVEDMKDPLFVTEETIRKENGLNEKINNLKTTFTATSIGVLFDSNFIEILSIQRGSQPPNTFGEVVSETSVRFLRENPFSLMRQHAVLDSLTKMTLSNEDRSTVSEYLRLTYQVIEKIQPVLTGLYHDGKKLKDSMLSLMDFAQKNPDYANLIRVLFLLCFDISRYSDRPNRKNLFNNRKLSTLKEWTFNSQTDIAPVDIEAFLRESAKQFRPDDLRLCLAALIEIDAAREYFGAEYTVEQHDAQTDAIRIHAGKFMHDYMLPVLLSQSNEPAQMSSIALLSQGSYDTAIKFEQALPSNLSFPTAFSPSMSLALAWGTSSINSITLKTLALLSTEADLSEWFNTLQQKIQEHDRHPVILLNSKMLEVINEFKSKPFNSENNYSFKIIDDVAVLGHENGVSSVEDFQKIMVYLYALLDFGQAVYYFWHSEYSKQNTTNVVSDPLKALYAVTYSAVYYIQHFINVLGDILPPLKLSSFDRPKKIAQLEKLQAQVNDFLEFVWTDVISSEETHNDIKTILGNHVDLSSEQFKGNLKEMIDQNNWEFVLGALFTLEHHHKPKVANILSICKYLNVEAARLSDQSSEIWQKLGPNFYSGQDSNSLCRLYSHYANNKPRPVIGCMKIAVFGFAYPSYAAIPANRRLFAGLVIDAFSKIVQISDSSIRDDKILHLTPNEKRSFTEALQYLLESQDILSAEEINACDAIYYNASSLRTDNQDLIDDLWKKAQRQQFVATLNSDVNTKAQNPITSLLGLEIILDKLKPQTVVKQQQLVDQQARVEALLVPGDGGKRPSDSALPARPASIRAGTKGDLLKEEYQDLLDALAAGAFPEEFQGRPVCYKQKNARKNVNFLELKNLLHKEIKKKSNNFTIKLNSKQLTDSIEEIYKESVSMKYTEFKNQGDQNPCDTTSILTGKHYNGHTLAVFANRLHIIQNECRDLPVAESDANLTNAAILITSQSSELDALHNMLEFESEDLGPQNGNADRPDSPELNRAVLADAVNKTIDWLLGDNPNSENIPTELKKLIAVNQLTSEGIEAKRTELMAITVDYFKRRLAMIKAGKYRDCLDHINKYRTPKVADELQNFIFRLNFYLISVGKTTFEETKGEVVNTCETIQNWRTLPAYYREFLWAVVESLMSYNDPSSAEVVLQIDRKKLDDFKLSHIAVALGLYCYVQMTDVERSQNAATLLQTLAQLILERYRENELPNTLRGEFIVDIDRTQKTFSNSKKIGSDINERALDLYCCIYTLMQIEFQVPGTNNSLSFKLILDQIHNNMRAHPDYLEWHRNILNNRHYDSPVNHLLYHRTTETYTAESAGKFDCRYFQPNLIALQAEGYWWSDDYTNTAKQPSIKAPTFRAEAAVVHILFTLLASKSDDLIEIVVNDVRYYDNKINKMRRHKQTLSIIDQVGFIFTLCKATENEKSPYGKALKLLRSNEHKNVLDDHKEVLSNEHKNVLDDHKEVLLSKARKALTRMVDYEGETKQKKRDSHDKEYGLVSAYQVAVLEDIKNILKTKHDMLEGYIKSVSAEEMSPDVFAFICSVLAKEKPESWPRVKPILNFFSTPSSPQKSNSNNTPPDMAKKKINFRLYVLVFTKQSETIALKQGSDRTSAIEQLEKNIRRYYLFDEYYTYVTDLFNSETQAALGDFDQILSLLTILVEYPYLTNPSREEVISFVCNKHNDSSLNDNDKVLIQTRIKSAIVEIYGKNIPPTVVAKLQSLSEPLAWSETYVERSTEEMNASLQEERKRLLPVSTFFSRPLRWISSLRAAGDHTDEGQNLLCRGSGGSES